MLEILFILSICITIGFWITAIKDLILRDEDPLKDREDGGS